MENNYYTPQSPGMEKGGPLCDTITTKPEKLFRLYKSETNIEHIIVPPILYMS